MQFYTTDEHCSRGQLAIASCCSGTPLADQIVSHYRNHLTEVECPKEILHLPNIDKRFSDDEVGVRIEECVEGADAFLIQSLSSPVNGFKPDQNYMSFLISAYALSTNGTNLVTGVVPYLSYLRQDKPTECEREPVTARLLADFAKVAGIQRMVVWHPHTDIHGIYGHVKIDSLDALFMMKSHFAEFTGRRNVIMVAPDTGATKFVRRLSAPNMLNLAYALADKYRPQPGVAEITKITGDFSGKDTAIIPDDMIASGGTMHALITKLVEEEGIKEVHIAVSHNLCSREALPRLVDLYDNYYLKQLMVTNSIPQTKVFLDLPFIRVKCLSDLLSRVINAIHYNRSISAVTRNFQY